MVEENVSREGKIRQVLVQEIEDGANLAAEARKMVEYLLLEKKGYVPGDIRKGVAFEVVLGQETAWSSADFLVSADGRTGMLIKCVSGSLDSRQRQVIAAARVIASPPVPVAVAADPENAVVLDVAAGKVIGEGFGSIPVREQLKKILDTSPMKALSLERTEKEKRILLAFDAIQCSVPRGADGGVRIGPEPEKEES